MTDWQRVDSQRIRQSTSENPSRNQHAEQEDVGLDVRRRSHMNLPTPSLYLCKHTSQRVGCYVGPLSSCRECPGAVEFRTHMLSQTARYLNRGSPTGS